MAKAIKFRHITEAILNFKLHLDIILVSKDYEAASILVYVIIRSRQEFQISLCKSWMKIYAFHATMGKDLVHLDKRLSGTEVSKIEKCIEFFTFYKATTCTNSSDNLRNSKEL